MRSDYARRIVEATMGAVTAAEILQTNGGD
jgi:hypothetical protein